MARLTAKEKEMLSRCGEFVLAGEWPWEGEGSEAFRQQRTEREVAALQSALYKIAPQARPAQDSHK